MRNYIAEFTLHQINEQTMWSSAKFWTDRLLQRSFLFILLYRSISTQQIVYLEMQWKLVLFLKVPIIFLFKSVNA